MTARAAVLMDATSGRILYEKEADLRLPPASTTKVVSAIVALESGRSLKQNLTVSKEATRVPASKLYLRAGQSLTVEELLYSIMLASANDAAMVLAEGIGGSVEHFSNLMTKKAHQIGAVNSNFTNPHGLTAPNHYSTAKDLALLFRYAMKNPTFREIVQTKFSSVRTTARVRKKIVPRRISVRNHNRLLWNFDGALGGKTGYTRAAQKCFVGAVQRNGATIIVAILGSRDLWNDTKRLLEYGFDHYDNPGMVQASAKSPSREQRMQAEGSDPKLVPYISESYILQVATFRDRHRAEAVYRRMSQDGFDVFIEPTQLPLGETAYRVRVGPYADLPSAQETAQDIFTKSGQQVLILPFGGIGDDRGDPS